MISRKYETIVGLFVVVALAALLVMVLVIAQQEGLWQDYVEYQTVFRNVSGLKKGSEVRLGGVTVGTVKSTVLRPDGKVLVTFDILEKYQNQVRNDAKATIGMIGLLGDRSLDIIGGTGDKPHNPKDVMAAVDPVDIMDFVTRAMPEPEKLQRVAENLEKITKQLADPEGKVQQVLGNLREITEKINQGKGTLGMLVNDPSLYREINLAAVNARKVAEGLNNPQGPVGMLLHDQALRAELKKTLADLNSLMATLRQGSVPVAEAAATLPGIMKKVQTVVNNLVQASAGLPDLVITGQTTMGDAGKAADAVLKSWLLRWAVPKPKERTIRMEREVK
jgi:phospholipid/cholesterol/gamma-HCH transport system substrate-binding protein